MAFDSEEAATFLSSRFVRFDEHRFDAEQGAAQRAPLLEQLLARADRRFELPDWRPAAFALLAPSLPMPPIAPSTLPAVLPETLKFAWAGLATPVHYVAEMSNVRLARQGILTLNDAEADALAVDFNRIWQGAGLRLLAAGAGLFCLSDAALDATTCDPAAMLGLHIADYLPSGRDAPRLRRLMSEMEMWLFDHAVNRARDARGLPVIGGLWLWGGGAPLATPLAIARRAAGRDVFFDAFQGDARGAAEPAAVMVLQAAPGSAAWLRMQADWLEPTLRDLRAGRIEGLALSAGAQCFSVSKRWRRRFWRRARPWWEYFHAAA